MLLCGATFELARKHARVSERCLQKWISRFNEGGIDAITYRPVPGRPRVMEKQAVEIEILPVVDDPCKAHQHHWTATKLCGRLREENGLDLSYRTLVRYLHEHDYARRIGSRFLLPSKPDEWEAQGHEAPRCSDIFRKEPRNARLPRPARRPRMPVNFTFAPLSSRKTSRLGSKRVWCRLHCLLAFKKSSRSWQARSAALESSNRVRPRSEILPEPGRG